MSEQRSEETTQAARRTTPMQDTRNALKVITAEQKRVTKELKAATMSDTVKAAQQEHLDRLANMRANLEEQLTQIRSRAPKRKQASAKPAGSAKKNGKSKSKKNNKSGK
jgi:hypothetical protein